MPDGNLLFLVCQPCEQENEADFGIKLAERSKIGWYEHKAPTKAFDAWLSKHRKCGGRAGPDHFILAHLHAKNHDQMPLSPVADAISRSLDS